MHVLHRHWHLHLLIDACPSLDSAVGVYKLSTGQSGQDASFISGRPAGLAPWATEWSSSQHVGRMEFIMGFG